MKITAFLAALAAFAVLPLQAQVNPESIKAELHKKLPEAHVQSVRKTPYGNLYEVVSDGEIFYTDDRASFISLGPIVDLNTKENVTETRLRQVNAVDFKALPFADAIKIVRGNGSRKIALFEDPNCGYCKRFERDFQGVTDITAYVFLYPILAADSYTKSKAIWCAPDPAKAWIDTMVHDRLPAKDGTCSTPLDKNVAFGQEKRIHGTPTLIFEDGQRLPGAISMAELEKRFREAKANLASAK
ncbi:MAG TPA: DsbC family protein [Usitatibacter sp.]|nr:DsbC family protein [Usitatibacter sp.]